MKELIKNLEELNMTLHLQPLCVCFRVENTTMKKPLH